MWRYLWELFLYVVNQKILEHLEMNLKHNQRGKVLHVGGVLSTGGGRGNTPWWEKDRHSNETAVSPTSWLGKSLSAKYNKWTVISRPNDKFKNVLNYKCRTFSNRRTNKTVVGMFWFWPSTGRGGGGGGGGEGGGGGGGCDYAYAWSARELGTTHGSGRHG